MNRRHTDFQSVDEKSQTQSKQDVSNTPINSLQTSLQKKSENGQNQGDKLPDDLAEIVCLWPELPEHIKVAIKALVQTFIREDK